VIRATSDMMPLRAMLCVCLLAPLIRIGECGEAAVSAKDAYLTSLQEYLAFFENVENVEIAWDYTIPALIGEDSTTSGSIKTVQDKLGKLYWEEVRYKTKLPAAQGAPSKKEAQYKYIATWDGKEGRHLNLLNRTMTIKPYLAIPSVNEVPIFLALHPYSKLLLCTEVSKETRTTEGMTSVPLMISQFPGMKFPLAAGKIEQDGTAKGAWKFHVSDAKVWAHNVFVENSGQNSLFVRRVFENSESNESTKVDARVVSFEDYRLMAKIVRLPKVVEWTRAGSIQGASYSYKKIDEVRTVRFNTDIDPEQFSIDISQADKILDKRKP
jgi:hypothetical protein